jgi:hypothetical protein
MASSGTLRHIALVRTDVSEEFSTSVVRVPRISELGTTLAITSNRSRYEEEMLSSSETSVRTGAIRRTIPEDAILQLPLGRDKRYE